MALHQPKSGISFYALARRFPSLTYCELGNVFSEFRQNPNSTFYVLSDRVVLLSDDRKIIARDIIPAFKLEDAS